MTCPGVAARPLGNQNWRALAVAGERPDIQANNEELLMSTSTGPRTTAHDLAVKATDFAEKVVDQVADATSDAASKAASLAGEAAHAATPYVEKAGESLEESAKMEASANPRPARPQGR